MFAWIYKLYMIATIYIAIQKVKWLEKFDWFKLKIDNIKFWFKNKWNNLF